MADNPMKTVQINGDSIKYKVESFEYLNNREMFDVIMKYEC